MAMVNLKMQKVRPPLFFESLHDPPPPPSGLWTADAVQLHKTEQQSHPSSTLFQYPPSGLFVSEVYRMKPSFLAFVFGGFRQRREHHCFQGSSRRRVQPFSLKPGREHHPARADLGRSVCHHRTASRRYIRVATVLGEIRHASNISAPALVTFSSEAW
jgi:hypothetical protein